MAKELSKGFSALARKLEEVATAISHSDIRTRLQAALEEAYPTTSGIYSYCYLVDVFGDDTGGNCVYSNNGDLMQAPYTIAASKGVIDSAKAVAVLPLTTYVPEAMAEAGARNSKTDLSQIQSIHEAAVKLGAECATKESAPISITGDTIPLREGAVGQDGTAYLKLIAPGWGSSGYYSETLLKRDGPVCFKAGTHNFWNHQTDAEEAQRPEGDLRDLASVLTEDAHYEKDGPTGPGLYAKAKVFEEFRQPVDDLAKSIGVSIRAAGLAKQGTAEGKTGPIIEKLTSGISVDYVTRAGAGGEVLQLFEAARAASKTIKEGAADMTDVEKADFKKLQEASVAQAALIATQALENRRNRERFALTDASGVIGAYFATVTVAEGIRTRITARLLSGTVPLTESGDLDKVKLTALVEAETKDETAYIAGLSGGRIVTGMGQASAELTEAQKTENAKALTEEMDRSASGWGFETPQGRKVFNEGRTAFDPRYNARKESDVEKAVA